MTLLKAYAAAYALILLGGCTPPLAPPPDGTGQAPQANSILVGSSPADGSTVAGPVNSIALHFAPPARLGEVTVTGPGGMMPMMVTAVGEVRDYVLPVSGLGSGAYRVEWKASIAGAPYQGSFRFTVR